MLPAGFAFRAYLDGLALYVAGTMVADIVPLDDGRWRVCMNVNSARRRYEFLPSEAVAVEYVTRWAAKWEAEIRAGAASVAP